MHNTTYFTYNIVMRKINKEKVKILNKLKTAKPEEVGAILKEYFKIKKP